MEKFPYKKVKETGEVPPQYIELLQNLFERYKAFEKQHEPRFYEVKKDNMGAIQSRGEFLPSDFEDFLEYCDIEDIDLSHDRITDAHFYGYHQWRLKDRYSNTSNKKGKAYSHLAGAIALLLALKNKKIDPDLFPHDKSDLIPFAYVTFSEEMKETGVKNPETNESTYKAWRLLNTSRKGFRDGIEWAKAKKTEHYNLGMRIYETHFCSINLDQE